MMALDSLRINRGISLMVRNSVLFRKNFPRNLYNRCDGFEEGFSIDILHQERKALQTYLYDNRWWLLLFNGLLLFIWGPWIANTAPRIDTEVLINTPYTPHNWLDLGRQGGILTECLFVLRGFNPIFSTVGGYLLICVAGRCV